VKRDRLYGRLEIALDPHRYNLEGIKMPGLFRKLFRPFSKAKRSAPANASPSATPATPLASTSHTSVDPAINLHLVTSPTVTDHQIDIQNEQKQRCIDHGITALEILKEISEANDALSPLEAICAVTLVILNTIEVVMGFSSATVPTDRGFQAMDSNEVAWKDVSDTIHKHRGVFEQRLHSTNRDQMRPDFDPKLLAAIQTYAR